MNLHEYIARQLNDHIESPSGVEQATYTEWSEQHISDAIYLGSMYLYTIMPNLFTDTKTKTIETSDCLVSFCDDDDCERFIELLTVNNCEVAEKSELETNNLMGLLDFQCLSVDEFKPTYQVLKNSSCMIIFDSPLPAGTKLTYLCANSPEDDKSILKKKYSKYIPLIADYALWCLYKTDTESRSNLDRARLHFEGVKDFVTNTLLMEFTLRDEGYDYGRRRTDGNANVQ